MCKRYHTSFNSTENSLCQMAVMYENIGYILGNNLCQTACRGIHFKINGFDACKRVERIIQYSFYLCSRNCLLWFMVVSGSLAVPVARVTQALREGKHRT